MPRRRPTWHWYPFGNATHLDIGWPPRRYDAALSTQALDRIVAHDVGDMTITAEAGVTLAALERVLAGHGQWLHSIRPVPTR